MRKGASKAKGNAFEREVAKKLATWYYDDVNALVRNASSGSLYTIREDSDLPPGDIVQEKYHEHKFPYSVECKHYKELKLEHLLMGRVRSKLYKFWVQTCRDADKAGLLPLMIWKSNFQETYCCTRLPSKNLRELSHKYIATKSLFIFRLSDFLMDSELHDMICSKRRKVDES